MNRPLRVGLMGTRGVPAQYGGFETAVEEIGQRLVQRGHHVTVYCRRQKDDDGPRTEHLGMHLVILPALRARMLETPSHTALSSLHALRGPRHDAIFLFNAANAVFLPVVRARRVPVAVHVDGLEWQRSKWGGVGRRYYRAAEALAVRWADALIADATGIADYYRQAFGATTELLVYGAPLLHAVPDDRLGELGLSAKAFHLVVARFEPENQIDLIVRGYRASRASLPLVVVGGAPYNDAYTDAVRKAAGDDPRVHLLGPVWDQEQLDQLYAHSLLYLHGHSVGGTNPSLLRAMGAGAAVVAFDVVFNQEVLGSGAWLFADEDGVRRAIESAEADPARCRDEGGRLQAAAAERFSWDDVTDGYERLAQALAQGQSRRGEATGRRRPSSAATPSRTVGRTDR